jgi:serine phosphatase RsbU (regulator of sigma subunit)
VKLRTQLALAFLLLAVLPLAGVTGYSYTTSDQAFRRAIEAEAAILAEQMSSQAEEVVRELGQRIQRMRERAGTEGAPSEYEKARRDALVAAEQAEVARVLSSIVSATEHRQGSIPFAIDVAKHIYTPDPADRPKLAALGLVSGGSGLRPSRDRDWVVVMRSDAESGIAVGVARPIGPALQAIRRTAARNLGFGAAMIALALLGIVPISRRMTRHLASLTEGAERLARGEIGVRVPVPHGAEFGRLAETFNRMARDLQANQDRLIQQERLRKELEIGRRIQEELLPRDTLRFPFAEVGGVSIPAREVGGDFFNYFPLRDSEAAVLVGDVSGKGVPAALLMANLQATLRARLPVERDLARLADHLDRDLASTAPGAPYVTLFMAVLDGETGRLRYVNAGHNTQFAVRASGGIEPLESTGRPIGLLPGGGFEERSLTLRDGDGLFLFTDGLVECENEAGEAFGMARIEAVLLEHRGLGLAGQLSAMDHAARAHRGSVDAADDATMLVLRFLLPAHGSSPA